MTKSKAPAWIYKYEKDYRESRITKEEIFRRENAKREGEQLPKLKFQSVSRAINALGLSSQDSFKPKLEAKPKQEQEAKPRPSEPEPVVITKPCYGCKYYTKKGICEYSYSMFSIYPNLSDFDKDFSEGRCKLKET